MLQASTIQTLRRRTSDHETAPKVLVVFHLLAWHWVSSETTYCATEARRVLSTPDEPIFGIRKKLLELDICIGNPQKAVLYIIAWVVVQAESQLSITNLRLSPTT